MVVLLTFFLTFQAHAKENWFCTTQSSQVFSDAVNACGVGTGETEARARLDAFDQAELEYRRVCGEKCSGSPSPMRTDCEESQGKFTCHRMVRFTLEESKLPRVAQGKIKAGMAKADLFAVLGRPKNVIQGDVFGESPYMQALFGSDVCTGLTCYVILKDNKVSEINGIKPELQEF